MISISRFSKAVCGLFLLASLSVHAQSQSTSDELYQSLGAKQGINTFVNSFVAIVLEDPRINKAFKDTDTERLAQLLTEQFCELSGGPCKYSGRSMAESHKDMQVTNAHFNALAEDLQIAMEKHNVPSSVQNRLIAKLAPMQRPIVTK
ncbi:group 1 truncated hemoglobin [Undibacterium sp. CY18W]|uniref:Group 1 truncated hemoglobin n=1 Tax=Undibacterium hunanense TaxID=2762292 RepID=A0ABR6ZM63_9BURK|nr:group 1 truncated hemoglobin [Undibacterium hunanense]MBC3916884.1 group 1 truncated hemoglobin [Undibacterium hunanense]